MNLKDELAGVLGINKHIATDEQIVGKVVELKIELHGKMGYCSKNILGKLLQEGHLLYNQQQDCYMISKRRLTELLK